MTTKKKLPPALAARARAAAAMTPTQRAAWAKKMQAARKAKAAKNPPRAAPKRAGRAFVDYAPIANGGIPQCMGCNGSGMVRGRECPDCNGTGKRYDSNPPRKAAPKAAKNPPRKTTKKNPPRKTRTAERRYWIALVAGDAYAHETKAGARAAAMPDRGQRVTYYTVTATDAGAARLMRREWKLSGASERKAAPKKNPPRKTKFVVVVVNGDASDSHAAPTKAAALELANPDEGAKLDIFENVIAADAGSARLPSAYRKGTHTRGKWTT